MRFDSVTEFAAQRRTDQDDMEKSLFPLVTEAMRRHPAQGWADDLLAEVARLYTDVYHREGGDGTPSDVDQFVSDVRDTLEMTDSPDDNTVDRVSTWLATAILNSATSEATGSDEEFVVMEWVTMHDKDVRPAHAEAEGQQRPAGEPFDVGGHELRYPGDPTAPIELWINCRCALAPALPNQFTQSTIEAARQEEAMTVDEQPTLDEFGVPWHGVLAPEGKWSGDGRRFGEGSLTFRDLPLPLTWQKVSDDGHKGSVVVAKIERLARVDGEMRGTGHYLTTPEADEAVGLLANFGRFGVSVDADDAEFESDPDTEKVTFTKARIASASQVPIPAFSEAWLALGESPEGFMPPDCDPNAPDYEECMRSKGAEPGGDTQVGMGAEFKDYDADQRKDAHTVPGTDSYPIEDCADLRNAIQAIGRAKDPAAVKRHIKSQKSRLGCADVEIPSDWSDETDSFSDIEQFLDVAPGRTEDGPGWLTHPVDTDRLRDYWVRGPGAAKIAWGTPGDFDRCRANVAEYVKPQYINGYCANRHYDATGFWPGRAPSEGGSEEKLVELARENYREPPAAALSLVAGSGWCAPSEWFEDPKFDRATPLTVTEDGRVSGHLAEWGTCHVGYPGTCVAPPNSASGYAYFLTGEVLTDKGSVPVGQITMDTGHAAPSRMRSALAHYDNTGTVVADVNCGEDAHGIWVAGWIRPGTPPEKVVALRASTLSGDWRKVGTEMEMIAALAVNSGGFPIPRVGINDGSQVSLVAAGVVEAQKDGDVMERLAADVEHRIAARAKRRQRMAELAAKVRGE